MPAQPNEIEIVRVYDAPVKLVWDVWTDLNHVGKWWGPRGFTLTTKSKDFRPGGKWIYTMHGPDGTDYPNIATYHEIVKYERLVYDHGGNEERQKLFTVTATFKEEQGKTTLHLIFAVDTAEAAKQMKEHIKNANGYSTWDRLGEYLAHQKAGEDPFFINRTFDADIDTVFDMWVKPEHVARWSGPTGSTTKFLNVGIKEGGTSLYEMKMGDMTLYGQAHYKKIQKPHLLVYVQNFSDKDGKLVKPVFAPNYPNQIMTTITFTAESENTTRVSLRWDVHGNATPAERDTFRGMRDGMTGGWNGSFDRLDEALAAQR